MGCANLRACACQGNSVVDETTTTCPHPLENVFLMFTWNKRSIKCAHVEDSIACCEINTDSFLKQRALSGFPPQKLWSWSFSSANLNAKAVCEKLRQDTGPMSCTVAAQCLQGDCSVIVKKCFHVVAGGGWFRNLRVISLMVFIWSPLTKKQQSTQETLRQMRCVTLKTPMLAWRPPLNHSN